MASPVAVGPRASLLAAAEQVVAALVAALAAQAGLPVAVGQAADTVADIAVAVTMPVAQRLGRPGDSLLVLTNRSWATGNQPDWRARSEPCRSR